MYQCMSGGPIGQDDDSLSLKLREIPASLAANSPFSPARVCYVLLIVKHGALWAVVLFWLKAGVWKLPGLNQKKDRR